MKAIKANPTFVVLLLFTCVLYFNPCAQVPNPSLVGYFHNWNATDAPYIQLDQIDNRYNLIEVAFALPKMGTEYKMEFVPSQTTMAQFVSEIQTLQNQGKKVLISIGGATSTVKINTTAEQDTFVSSMNDIINTYGFDGIDIDLEGSSVSVNGGTISAPTDQYIILLIDGIKQIMADYHTVNGKKLLLTMAPETAYVQGGQSAFGGIWGAYLPIIDALRDSIDILQVQLYNSGSMYGIDGNVYTQATADFIVAMGEAVIQGFNTSGGQFAGLPANKVAIGLPACNSAAGGGYANPAVVESALDYLMGNGGQPGTYSLANPAGYPDLRGMMTWSINWDAVSNCGSNYEFAQLYQDVFGGLVGYQGTGPSEIKIYPNPVGDHLYIASGVAQRSVSVEVLNLKGQLVFQDQREFQEEFRLDVSALQSGVYVLRLRTENEIRQYKLLKE